MNELNNRFDLASTHRESQSVTPTVILIVLYHVHARRVDLLALRGSVRDFYWKMLIVVVGVDCPAVVSELTTRSLTRSPAVLAGLGYLLCAVLIWPGARL
jgi:hypothetical protein